MSGNENFDMLNLIHKTIKKVSSLSFDILKDKSVDELDLLLKNVLFEFVKLCNGQDGTFILFGEEGNKVISLKEPFEILSKFKPNEHITSCIVEKGRTLKISDVFKDAQKVKDELLEKMHFSPVEFGGKVKGVFGVVADITDEKKELLCSLGTVLGLLLETIEKGKVLSNLSRYFSPQVVRLILKKGESILSGKKEATVFVADISDFTSLTQKLSYEELLFVLNEFFSLGVSSVFRWNGVIDKFTGDGILAVFGVPFETPDYTKNALMCARDMLSELRMLNEKFKIKGFPEIDIKVAITTGEVIFGDVGPVGRMEFIVLGIPVNLASRLEKTSEQLGAKILIDKITFEKIRDLVAVKEHKVSVKGFEEEQKVYEVLAFR